MHTLEFQVTGVGARAGLLVTLAVHIWGFQVTLGFHTWGFQVTAGVHTQGFQVTAGVHAELPSGRGDMRGGPASASAEQPPPWRRARPLAGLGTNPGKGGAAVPPQPRCRAPLPTCATPPLKHLLVQRKAAAEDRFVLPEDEVLAEK